MCLAVVIFIKKKRPFWGMDTLHFLAGKEIVLRPLLEKDFNETYLGWLNDPEVNVYSGRSLAPTSEQQMREYVSHLNANEWLLAICTKDGKHIGNIKVGPIDHFHKSADISIMIGDKNFWGKGYARQAMYFVMKHLFQTVGLHRLEAGTINPAFAKSVLALGWKQEGVYREGYFFQGAFVDVLRFSILQQEFKEDAQYEEE